MYFFQETVFEHVQSTVEVQTDSGNSNFLVSSVFNRADKKLRAQSGRVFVGNAPERSVGIRGRFQ